MSVWHTHEAVETVKENQRQSVKSKRRRHFESLDRKAQAYMGLVEYSGLSFEATALFQYLMCKQGSNTHAFPSMREMSSRFKCHARKIREARAEILEALPEVFNVVCEGGKARDSYYLTPYRQWPHEVCERLWFSVAKVDTQCVAKVATQPPLSVSKVATLHGNIMCDSTYGDSEAVEEVEVCFNCNKPATTKYRGYPICETSGGECHQEAGAMF